MRGRSTGIAAALVLLALAAIAPPAAAQPQFAVPIATTLQNAATASGNGNAVTLTGMSSAVLTVNCATCSGGTTINFEGSADGTNFASVKGIQLGTSTIATSTTTAGVTVWKLAVGGLQQLRARVSAYSAGTVTVTVQAIGASTGPDTVDIGTLGTSITPGTAAANLGKAEDAAAVSGDTGVFALGVINATSSTQVAQTGDYAQVNVDHYGTLISRSDHPNRFHCVVAVSTATTLTATGGSCAAPGAGLSLYITDISFGSSAAGGTAADSFPTLKSGTGGTCGTATAVIWQAMTAANVTTVDNRTIPIKVTANSEVCWIMSTAGSKTLQISGFIAP